MAYLYRKDRSPFWYVVYFDSDQKERHRSTGLRADDPGDTAKAKSLRAELEAKEHHRAPMVETSSWDSWVPKFFERHCKTEKTLERYIDAWKWPSLWLQRRRIYSPRQLTYKLGTEYVDWRTNFKKHSGKTVGKNTAIFETKILSMVMAEAVRLGLADANPLVSLKLAKDKPTKKPEICDEEIIKICTALKKEPEWMQVSFAIALHTGCRLRETRIPIDCIDFKERKMTFPTPKGGDKRAFSIPMPTALELLLRQITESRKDYTLDFPFQPSRRWSQFFIKMKMTHLCFHCTRVTYISRLRRAGVPIQDAMRLVNHASELIHKVYQRETIVDVEKWRDAVKFPG